MLKLRVATVSELFRYYSAMQLDFDERELLPRMAIQKAIRRGDQ